MATPQIEDTIPAVCSSCGYPITSHPRTGCTWVDGYKPTGTITIKKLIEANTKTANRITNALSRTMAEIAEIEKLAEKSAPGTYDIITNRLRNKRDRQNNNLVTTRQYIAALTTAL